MVTILRHVYSLCFVTGGGGNSTPPTGAKAQLEATAQQAKPNHLEHHFGRRAFLFRHEAHSQDGLVRVSSYINFERSWPSNGFFNAGYRLL